MNRFAKGVLPLAAALFLSLASQPANAHAVTGAKLEADPKHYEGVCPTMIKFHGSIETNGPGVVRYIFERSDGGIDTIVKAVTFTVAPFHQNIPDTTWTLGGPGMTYSGWERIKIVSPNAGFLSNKAAFRIQCKGDTQPGENPNGRPDLVVTTFGFKGPVAGQGQCLPHTAVYIFEVTVKNQGTAASPSSASLGNKALVQAMAQDKAGWGNGMFLNALPPGASQTVDIPVYYLMSDYDFMVNNAPHPFMAIADPLGLVNESDESNNKKGPIKMSAPANCKKTAP
jgi:hypothetical protein